MKNNPVEIDIVSSNSKLLYVFFGGITAGIAIPKFEFYNSSRIINENKIFIRDFSQTWYQSGIPGKSNDIYTTAEYIKSEIAKLNPERLFFVGNSMGGYAAILFATLIGKGEVIAFVPQTFISPLLRFKYGDRRWSRKIWNTYKKGIFKKKIWDLKPLLKNRKHHSKISIFTSVDDELDLMHALYISDMPGVDIYKFESGGHAIVRVLRDERKLPAIMSGTYEHVINTNQ